MTTSDGIVQTGSDTDTGRGPTRTLRVGTTDVTLLGTAHVSAESARDVKSMIESGEFDAVAIELCPSRYQSMTRPDDLEQLNLFQVLRQGKGGLVAANLALGAFQQRVAEEAGIEPGAEMRAAIDSASAGRKPLWLLDRDVGTTLKRVYRNVPWWQRSSLVMGLFGSLISREKVSPEDIERLKEGDVLSATFESFAADSAAVYEPLIRERDEFMALRLREEIDRNNPANVLVVVGAGHLAGLADHLSGTTVDDTQSRLRSLNTMPPPARWPRAIPWLIAAIILGGFVIGFSRSTALGWELIANWFLINGVLTAIGSAVARGHPGTIAASFVAAPFTSLNPTIGAGFVAAAVEIWLRKPRVSDFSHLRQDVARVTGWWRNRVSRTLLVFIFASLGSMAGTYVGGFRVFGLLSGG